MKEIIEKIKEVRKSLPSEGEINEAQNATDSGGDMDFLESLSEMEGFLSGLEFALKIFEDESTWIPVSERLPEAFSIVLVIEKYQESRFVGWWDSRKWAANSDQFSADGWDSVLVDQTESEYVTHWMPLPKPPKP